MKTPRILTTTIALLLAPSLFAITDIWDGGGGSDNIAVNNNWLDNTAPVSDLSLTDLIFDGTVRLTPNFSVVLSANSLTFANNAAVNPFTFSGSALTIGTTGIVNSDAQTQTLNNQVTLGTATSTFAATSGALNFGTVALAANTLNFVATTGTSAITTLTGTGTVNKSGAGGLTFGAAGAVTQAWDLVESAGIFTLNAASDLTVSTTGSISVNAGTYQANGNVTMNATPLVLGAGAVLNIATAKTLTLQNGGTLQALGDFTHAGGGTIVGTGAASAITVAGVFNVNDNLNLLAGADAAVTTALNVGTSGFTAILNVDGSGSTFTGPTVSGSFIGNLGGNGTFAVSNAGSASFGSLLVAANGATSVGLLSVQSGGQVTATSLTMADDTGTSQNATVTVDGAGSSMTLTGAISTIGAATASAAAINVQNAGVFSTSATSPFNVNATGTLNVNGGTFNANGNLTLNGGQLARNAAGAFTLAAGKTLTVQAGADAIFTGGADFATAATTTVTGAGSTLSSATSGYVRFQGGSTLNVLAGADVFASFGFEAGTAGGATVLVDGAGSKLDATGFSTTHRLGEGALATVTFSNAAQGDFDFQLDVANSATPGSVANVTVNSGATVTSGGIFIATLGGVGNSGSITVDGAGSSWNLLLGTFQIGAASGSTGSVTISNGGTFTTGSIGPQISPTGTLTVTSGGILNVNGTMNVTGGQFTQGATGIFDLDAGRIFRVQAGGTATFNNHARFAVDTNAITVTGAGSLLSAPGTADILINGGSSYSVLLGGAVSTGRWIDIGTSGTSTTNSLLVDGAGSSVTTSSALSSWGGNTVAGGNAVVTFQNNAAGTIGAVNLGVSNTSGSTGTLLIASGADVTMGALAIASTAVATTGTTTVTGAGTTLTLNSGATLTIGAASASTATLNVNDGAIFTASTGAVTLNATGTLNIGNGTVTLPGPLTRAGGTVNFTSGTLNIVDNWNVGPGGLIGSNVTLDPTRRFSTAGTTTIDVLNTLTLNGGIFSTGSIIINGSFAFNSGTLAITGAGGFNIGTGGLGSLVTLEAGRTLQVANTTTINSGALLRLDGGSFSGTAINNNGTIDHADGVLNFTGTLNNNGLGRMFVGGLASPAGAIANGGRITLQNGIGFLGGAGTITNTGLITGEGTVAKPVTNSASGQLRAELGKTLTFTGAITANAGTFSLQGGTLEFTSAITNSATGFISGRGSLITTGLVNQGVMAFSGGTADVFGDVTNSAGARIVTSGAGSVTTFYDDVIHNGLEIFTGASASTVFFGAQSGAGSFTGTGTVYFIGDLRPGNSPALVSYGGDVAFGGSSSLLLEIGGLNVGAQYDHLDVAGTLFADGALEIALLDGFTPRFGDTFDLLNVGTFTGDFDSITAPALSGGNEWDFSNLKTTGTVTVVPEPGAALLALLGLSMLRLRARRRAGNFSA